MVGKPEVWQATGTAVYDEAVQLRLTWKRQKLAEWNAILAGVQSPTVQSRYQVAAELASSKGFKYRPVTEFRPDELDDAIGRLLSLDKQKEAPGSVVASAIMGLTDTPRRTLLEMAKEMPDLFSGEIASKTDAQSSVWKAKWNRVAKRMVDHLGEDRAIDDLREEDAMGLVADLQKLVDVRMLTADSANKDIAFLNRMIREHHKKLKRPKPVNIFAGHRTTKPVGRKRLKKPMVPMEYLEKWIILAAWGRINDEVRDICLVALETGCRASEIYNLPPSAIRLDAAIPHILIAVEIEGEYKREIKTDASDREIPLVGSALEAMRRHPEGFDRYRGKRGFNNVANKSMRAAGLLPSEPVGEEWRAGKKVPVYVTISSIRHSFEQRLKDAKIDSDDRGELMGHDVGRIREREEYSQMPLHEKLAHHKKIVLTPKQALPKPVLSLPSG
jgi:integrase